ncbi:DUF6916 family protein [Kordiimonas marina]|uniref:DUF6916 family protein n=1 Tax=Kordiimonas marina TaxID=2872312 RepID=UPI001FF433FE|nr:hypothetical protein [Kordiimonas marina]MCJ9429437.1 hypothetical protein [Kordiimonas marina]
MLDQLSVDKFEKLVGSDVKVTVMTGPNLTLTLDGVRKGDFKCDCMPEGCRAQSFTLTLSGPANYQVKDGTYDLSFDTLGAVPGVYMDNKGTPKPEPEEGAASPESAGPQRVLYEVVFS